jgi:arylamine N-acetyltransferase
VPFENISKLWRLKRLELRRVPSLDLFLEGIRRCHFGGTCYANNLHLWRLLVALGFDATLCGADMPSGEDVHVAITVSVAGRSWLVDAGYAAPFVAPLPLDLDHDHVVRSGADRWVLKPPDRQGTRRLEQWRDDEPLHGYLLKPTACPAAHFDRAVAGSFRPDATFMNTVLAVRCFARRTVTVLPGSVIRGTPTNTSIEHLADREALIRAITAEIGIPEDIVREAISGLNRLGSAYG